MSRGISIPWMDMHWEDRAIFFFEKESGKTQNCVFGQNYWEFQDP
jgi:hypothetical protein